MVKVIGLFGLIFAVEVVYYRHVFSQEVFQKMKRGGLDELEKIALYYERNFESYPMVVCKRSGHQIDIKAKIYGKTFKVSYHTATHTVHYSKQAKKHPIMEDVGLVDMNVWVRRIARHYASLVQKGEVKNLTPKQKWETFFWVMRSHSLLSKWRQQPGYEEKIYRWKGIELTVHLYPNGIRTVKLVQEGELDLKGEYLPDEQRFYIKTPMESPSFFYLHDQVVAFFEEFLSKEESMPNQIRMNREALATLEIWSEKERYQAVKDELLLLKERYEQLPIEEGNHYLELKESMAFLKRKARLIESGKIQKLSKKKEPLREKIQLQIENDRPPLL